MSGLAVSVGVRGSRGRRGKGVPGGPSGSNVGRLIVARVRRDARVRVAERTRNARVRAAERTRDMTVGAAERAFAAELEAVERTFRAELGAVDREFAADVTAAGRALRVELVSSEDPELPGTAGPGRAAPVGTPSAGDRVAGLARASRPGDADGATRVRRARWAGGGLVPVERRTAAVTRWSIPPGRPRNGDGPAVPTVTPTADGAAIPLPTAGRKPAYPVERVRRAAAPGWTPIPIATKPAPSVRRVGRTRTPSPGPESGRPVSLPDPQARRTGPVRATLPALNLCVAVAALVAAVRYGEAQIEATLPRVVVSSRVVAADGTPTSGAPVPGLPEVVSGVAAARHVRLQVEVTNEGGGAATLRDVVIEIAPGRDVAARDAFGPAKLEPGDTVRVEIDLGPWHAVRLDSAYRDRPLHYRVSVPGPGSSDVVEGDLRVLFVP